MSKKAPCCMISATLVMIGGLNLGLTGLGTLIDTDLNVLNMLLGSWVTVEAIVYVVIGLSAICMIAGIVKHHKCCSSGKCD